ncbi:DUF4192 domain-containing protein [Nocardioides sp. BP30]|uniref:DUF4192 domain-containing protein n=1 Tax=Nocardioides sp. BP30 TaxID=3036374 RepID=UPI0024699BAD|nr:DUF4192 domain-containing protein [Nocardioides sp. BP30]WGL53929.1 DUF4192 domain-containing protein [Nocardioides sp. BP30]
MTITLRAKTPEDLLAAIPVTLGFEPQDSVVMLTFGGPAPLHARIDLPPRGDPDALAAVVESLLGPCLLHAAPRVVFVLYGAGAVHGRHVVRALRRGFERKRIEVLECLRVDGGRWYSADGRRPDVPAGGVPYDSDRHRFRAEAVMAGHVTLGSRDELAASLAVDEPGRAGVEAVLGEAVLLSAAELATVCARHADAGTVPTDVEAAALLSTVQVGARRDAAWVPLTRDSASGHVRLWRGLVRRAPEALRPAAAAVLAFAAWLQGDGALAWCALDRCFATDPGHSLGRLVAHLLSEALPPTAWESMRPALDEAVDPGGWSGEGART